MGYRRNYRHPGDRQAELKPPVYAVWCDFVQVGTFKVVDTANGNRMVANGFEDRKEAEEWITGQC